MTAKNGKFDFFGWFDCVIREAEQTPAGRAMLADHGAWTVIHTGGGCLAWEMRSLDGSAGFWICTPEQGLGRTGDEEFLVGIHPDLEWNDHWQGHANGIAEAMALCHAAHAARCFAAFFRDDAKLTLAEFSASARPCADLGRIDESVAGTPGVLYHGDAYIQGTAEQGHSLVIGNAEYQGDLPKLEPILYAFAYGEGYLDAAG